MMRSVSLNPGRAIAFVSMRQLKINVKSSILVHNCQLKYSKRYAIMTYRSEVQRQLRTQPFIIPALDLISAELYCIMSQPLVLY